MLIALLAAGGPDDEMDTGDRSNIEDMRGPLGRNGHGCRRTRCGWFVAPSGVELGHRHRPDVASSAAADPPAPPETVGTSGEVKASPEEEKLVDMVDAVMDDAQETWRQLLGGRYQDTKAVLFRDAINSACGFAQSATGPFYCPADHKVYLDLGFFDEMQRKLGAPGDFAQAYVLAHELGHHVQTLTGIEGQVRQRQSADRRSPQRAVGADGAPGRLFRRRLGHITPTSGGTPRAARSG